MSSQNNQKPLPKYPKITILGLITVGGWIIWEGVSNYGIVPHSHYTNRRRFLNQILAEIMQKVYEIGGANAILSIFILLGCFFFYAAYNIYKKMKKIIALFTMSVLALSCNKTTGDKEVKSFIDNPTLQTITAEVDGKSYTINANTYQEIDLKEGKHNLKTSNGEIIEFEKTQLPIVINPTKSTYIIHTEAYTDNPNRKNIAYEMKFKEVEIDGKVFFAPIEVKNDHIISGNWKFSLNENFSDNIDVNSDGSETSFNIMLSKIYRSADYIKEYSDYIIKK